MLSTLRQALHLIGREERSRWILLVVLAVAVSGLEMIGAVLVFILLSLVVDQSADIVLPLVGDIENLTGEIDHDTLLLSLVVAMGAFFVFRALVKVAAKYIQYRVAHNAGARLSNRFVEGYLNWPYATHLRRNSAELIRNGLHAVQQVVTGAFLPIIKVAADSLIALGMLAVMVAIAPAATGLAIVIIGVAAALLLIVIQPKLKHIGKTAHRMGRETLKSLQQSLQGLRDIKVLGREQYFATQYSKSRLKLARASYLRSTIGALPPVIIETALLGFILLSFGFAVVGGVESQEVLSILGLFAYVALRLQPSLQNIIGGFNDLRHASAPLEDLHADLVAVESVPTGPSRIDPLPFRDSVCLQGVTFRYEGAHSNALSDIDLTITRDQQVGICGPTGGGKTTLADIIIGLLEPTEGRVTIDGVDLIDNTRAWQQNLGVVSQVVFLIDDTLRRNVALGVPEEEVDEEALSDAIELAQLTGFIASLPNGLNTTVGERGVRISGGQRQRIAIARALYRRPAVLVFDEGTSALDNATEAQLMASIERLRGHHTIILIAHRLSTVRNSDRVIFVDEGRIAGEGSYETLLQSHSAFRSMVMEP